MSKGYVTKRISPDGYVAVTRSLAEELYNKGIAVTLCGNDVNSYHVFGGWRLGCTVEQNVNYDGTFEVFDSRVSSFLFHLEPELGKYAVYYIQEKDI